MDYQEYKSKMKNLDEDRLQKFNEIFKSFYPLFFKMSYSEIELFSELLKRTASNDSVCITQLWQGNSPKI